MCKLNIIGKLVLIFKDPLRGLKIGATILNKISPLKYLCVVPN